MTAVKQMSNFDVNKIREDFPILSRNVHGKPLVYLDNGGSSQSPASVIARFDKYHSEEHSNVHRGVHYLSQLATNEYEKARVKVQKFINAREAKECIFVRGCTEGVNLVAQSYGRANFNEGDEIILSQMEHHANIIPWQMIAEEKGAKIRVIPMNERGELILDEYENMFNERTKFVSIIHVSNALGTINPVKSMIETAHKFGVPVMVDAAQSIPHMKVDVQDLDCDFLTFSGHKMFALSGSGVLYGKKEFLEKMPPYQTGGSMIRTVTFEKTTFAGLPEKFEAGTPAIATSIAIGAAIDYLNEIGMDKYHRIRTRIARIRDKENVGNRRRENHRNGGKQSLSNFLHDRRHSPARHRHNSRPRRHRHPCRTPLCPADHAIFRDSRDRPCEFCVL